MATAGPHRAYLLGTLALLVFCAALVMLEQRGLSREWISSLMLGVPLLVYAAIGASCRTADAADYYVAGRQVPAFYNGMATAADWMSAATFIGLAGTLYLTGFGGLAFVMGWTGGYCLLALLLAPYLRRFGQYTIPDFLAARFGGHPVRLLAVGAAILCSFVYLVAQIYGVGLITARLTGLSFEIGAFLALGGILLCSFLGGMRAVTWTQAAQYIVLLVAYLVPVVWLSVKQTGVPIPQAVYAQQLHKIGEREAELLADPRERQVIELHQQQAELNARKLQDVRAALEADRQAARQKVSALHASQASLPEIQAAEKALAAWSISEEQARRRYQAALDNSLAMAKPLAGMPPHAQAFAGQPNGGADEQAQFEDSRRNFLALVFCLMAGTAALPHILMRYYTTSSVSSARRSVVWALFFILLVYLTAPALAVLVKFEILTHLVGLPFDQLPSWVANWSRTDASLVAVSDINHDGVFQLAEMRLGSDAIVLATPEIGGMPFAISALVAAGALAAALSTADGLLLTIANALSHDVYYKVLDQRASTGRRVAISKALLLIVALAAAALAAQKPADILFLVSAAFSCAASALFPALVLGIFWSRANHWGALAGMTSGLAITLFYLSVHHPGLRSWWGIHTPWELWWGIQPIAAGVFGVPVGAAVMVVVSLCTPAPSVSTLELVQRLRTPQS